MRDVCDLADQVAARITDEEVEARLRRVLAGAGIPLADPAPPPVMISQACGCTFMDIGGGVSPAQVSWCVRHDPGYETKEGQPR